MQTASSTVVWTWSYSRRAEVSMSKFLQYCALVAFIPVACTPNQKNGQSQQIVVHVSETHLKLFTDLQNKTYNAADASTVLAKISGKANRFCRGTVSDAANKADFLKSTGTAEYAADWPKHNYAAMLLGCRNWFTMSDIGIDDDFIRINAEYASKTKQAFDCYSVGFLQPYIMAASLNCARLNIVDSDFRIIKAHLDFMNLIRSKPGANIRALIADLRFSFAAGGPQNNLATDAVLSIADLCGKNSETRCIHYLVNFLEKFSKIKEINLILAPLHEFRFLPDKLRAASVFYTSNALDPDFTTAKQFEQFRTESGKSAEDADRLIIYHQSEERSFGIYKLNKVQQISTVCADRYRNITAGSYSSNRCRYFPGRVSEYETYLDKKSVNHQIKNYCSERN